MSHEDQRKLQALNHLASFAGLRLDPGEQLQLALTLLLQVGRARMVQPDGAEVPLPPELRRLRDAALEAHRAAERVLTTGLVTAVAGALGGLT